jgi:tRNA threonylcarbamoyladenosine biosynthesis protein TsaE
VDSYEAITRGVERTRVIGAVLGKLAEAGDTLLLRGELGAGKTCLTQGVAAGLGVAGYVVSPTFVLVREYRGRLTLYHIDLYRLQGIDEVAEMGVDDYLYGNGICVVEWAEKGMGLLPREHLMIELQHLTTTRRRLSFEPRGRRYEEMISGLASAMSDSLVAGK